jgi:hypothetical protein
MRFRLLWTIMVDHRLPKIRAVDLRRQSGSAFFGLAGELGFPTRLQKPPQLPDRPLFFPAVDGLSKAYWIIVLDQCKQAFAKPSRADGRLGEVRSHMKGNCRSFDHRIGGLTGGRPTRPSRLAGNWC